MKNLIQKYLTLPLLARIGIPLLGSAIGGLGVGVLSEYAAYYYALEAGFRPPFEGIPYLRPTVSAFTFILLFGLFIGFASVYLLIGWPLLLIRKLFERMSDNYRTKAKSDPDFATREYQAIPHLLSKRIMTTSFYFYGIDIDPVKQSLKNNDEVSETLEIMANALDNAKILDPKGPIIFASMSGIFAVIALSVLLFQPKLYNKLLCSMTYGGDIPVVLYLKNDGISNIEKEEGELVLRSETAITIRTESVFKEYPVSSIRSIEYADDYNCTW